MVMIPTIHLNGTQGEELLSLQETACLSLRLSLAAMQDAGPHGRDYYPQGDTAFSQAVSEYQVRVTQVTAALNELVAIRNGIRSALKEREDRKKSR